MNLREKILSNTLVYKTFKNLVAPPERFISTIREFFDVAEGSKILDLGCGYGDIAHFYSGRSKYLGVDSNESYIKEARRRNGHNDAEFLVADVSDDEVLRRGPFDLVMMTGVLHHLPDELVSHIARASKELVSPSGRFVAMEPVFDPDQRLSARLIIASDRGRFVRDAPGYTALLNAGFSSVSVKVVHDRLRIPYSHAIITCTH